MAGSGENSTATTGWPCASCFEDFESKISFHRDGFVFRRRFRVSFFFSRRALARNEAFAVAFEGAGVLSSASSARTKRWDARKRAGEAAERRDSCCSRRTSTKDAHRGVRFFTLVSSLCVVALQLQRRHDSPSPGSRGRDQSGERHLAEAGERSPPLQGSKRERRLSFLLKSLLSRRKKNGRTLTTVLSARRDRADARAGPSPPRALSSAARAAYRAWASRFI